MATHLWTILCARATIDSQTNALSLIDVIEELTVTVPKDYDPSKPVLIPIQLVLVSLFARTDREIGEKSRGRCYLEGPSGNTYPTTTFDVDLGTFIRVRCLINATGLPARESGTHYFRIEIETSNEQFTQVARLPFDIIIKVLP